MDREAARAATTVIVFGVVAMAVLAVLILIAYAISSWLGWWAGVIFEVAAILGVVWLLIYEVEAHE